MTWDYLDDSAFCADMARSEHQTLVLCDDCGGPMSPDGDDAAYCPACEERERAEHDAEVARG